MLKKTKEIFQVVVFLLVKTCDPVIRILGVKKRLVVTEWTKWKLDKSHKSWSAVAFQFSSEVKAFNSILFWKPWRALKKYTELDIFWTGKIVLVVFCEYGNFYLNFLANGTITLDEKALLVGYCFLFKVFLTVCNFWCLRALWQFSVFTGFISFSNNDYAPNDVMQVSATLSLHLAKRSIINFTVRYGHSSFITVIDSLLTFWCSEKFIE